MWRFGSLFAVTAGVIAVIAISGAGHTGDPDGPGRQLHEARNELALSLDDVASRLDILGARLMRTDGVLDGVGDSPAAALHVELVQLSDRRRTIISTLDSLEQAGGAWRGAMAGLRASVADLEYRVDAFELGLAATGAELDVLLAGWLEEADRGIEALYRAAADSAPDPFRDERLELHSHVNQLNERSASFAGRTGDAELGARRAFGRETIGMRRRLRAVIRSVQRASQPVPD